MQAGIEGAAAPLKFRRIRNTLAFTLEDLYATTTT